MFIQVAQNTLKCLWKIFVLSLIVVLGFCTYVYFCTTDKYSLSYKTLEIEPDYQLLRDRDNKLVIRGYNHSATISPAAISKDIDVMVYALENSYIGKYELPNDEYVTLIRDLKKLKRNNEITTVDQFENKIEELFDQITDGHLAVNNPFRKPLTSSYTAVRYTIDNKVINNKRISVLRIFDFMMSQQEFDKLIAELDAHNLLSSDGLVLDLRDNPGGRVGYAESLIDYLKGSNFTYADILNKISMIQTTETKALRRNTYIQQMGQAELFSGKNLTEYNNALSDYDQDIQKSLTDSNKYIVQCTFNVDQTKHWHEAYKKPILILVNNKSASSSELTTLLIKTYFPQTKVVGKNSSGALKYIDPHVVKLPNSNIIAEIPTVFLDIKSNLNFVEKKGITPDVTIDASKPIDDYLNAFMSTEK